MSNGNGLKPEQERFAHYFGIFAGVASITGLVLGLRALMKEKEYEKKFGLLAPLLEEQGLGATPNYETLKEIQNPEQTKKKKQKLYHAIVRYDNCDDSLTGKELWAAAKKQSKNFDFYCQIPSNRINFIFPALKSKGILKEDAAKIVKWAKKNLSWKTQFSTRIIRDKRGKAGLFGRKDPWIVANVKLPKSGRRAS
jgi:hypothetical protein